MDEHNLNPEDEASGSITMLYRKWRSGHCDSLAELMERFRPRLLSLARTSLTGRVQRVADAEDALQSAMFNFWQQAERGDFSEELDRNDLWGILGVMTVRKSLKMRKRESAQKRGGGKEVAAQGPDEVPAPDQGPSPEMLCMELLELLDEELRPYAVMRLSAFSVSEMAQEFDCTERKVERKLKLVREVWKQEIDRWNA